MKIQVEITPHSKLAATLAVSLAYKRLTAEHTREHADAYRAAVMRCVVAGYWSAADLARAELYVKELGL